MRELQSCEGSKHAPLSSLTLQLLTCMTSAAGMPQELQQEFREENKQALLNVISDAITGMLLFVILATNNDGRNVLFRTIGRVFGGLSDTAKAFLIIASTDILLGWARLAALGTAGTPTCDRRSAAVTHREYCNSWACTITYWPEGPLHIDAGTIRRRGGQQPSSSYWGTTALKSRYCSAF